METKNNPWMPLYIGDYLKDTASLTQAEHGAYIRLIMLYWNNSGPIPDDMTKIYRATGAISPEEQANARSILQAFFKHQDGEYHHKRIDAEIARSIDGAAKRKAKAFKASKARWDAPSIPTSNAPSIPPSNAQSNAPAMPYQNQSQNQSHIPEAKPKPKNQSNDYSPEFELFWETYPKNAASKKESFKSFIRALTISSCDEIMGALKPYAQYCEETQTPVCHATTWLNQERWKIDYVNIPRQGRSLAAQKPSITKQQEEAAARLRAAFGMDNQPNNGVMRDVTPQQD